jgi:hypothetical protein
MTRYRMTFKCAECCNVFKKITSDANLQSTPCPACRRAKTKSPKSTIKFMRMGDGPVTDADLLAEKIAKKLMDTPEFQASLASKLLSPTSQSSQNQIKAIDTTAEVVMQDYKMGDLKDNVRTGDTMAPRLPPAQQAKADAFFGGAGRKRAGSPFNPRQIAAMVNSGGLRPEANGVMNPVAQMHKHRTKPPVHIINSTGGKN